MAWTEMEKKTQNHVVLGPVVMLTGNTRSSTFKELKAKEKNWKKKKQFMHNSKSV